MARLVMKFGGTSVATIERIRHVAKHSSSTFVVTNNHYQGKAIVNALQLIHLLTGNKVKVPEPLRHRYPELEAIASEPQREPTPFPELPPESAS